MIVIDGRKSSMDISSFANLEEILVKVMEEEVTQDHIITDVLLNNENFSEIYPHHAEDIETEEISRVEVHTVSAQSMALDIVHELSTVILIMQKGTSNVSTYLRQGDIAEGLEVLQDLLDVTRHFLATVGILHQQTPLHDISQFTTVATSLDSLLTEMNEVMADQDWLVLSDLLEYEFSPACEEWEQVLSAFTEEMAAAKVE